MSDLQEYKCPCCGGSVAFDSESQMLKCPYCDTEFKVDDLKAYGEALDSDREDSMEWEDHKEKQWEQGEETTLRSYICRSCGGEIVCDSTTAATSCPFCGNAVVMSENVSGMLKPDLVIPFKLTKEDAKAALLEHYEGKKLLPPVFREENHIENIKGVYVPVWLFDTESDGTVRYHATTVRSWSDYNYHYTETCHFAVVRGGRLAFEAVPVDGSKKMPDDIMESIEPYDLGDAVDFNTAYLAGFFADKYDVGSKDSVARANERVKASTENAFLSTVHGYTTVFPEHSSISFSGGKVRYALYPVWMLDTEWNGEHYKFAMNGQTGKFAGDLPVDKHLKNKYFWITAGIAAAATVAVQLLLMLLH